MNLKNSMKFASRLVVAAALCGAVVFTSCKKDDDDDKVLPSMDGQLSFKLPLYSLVGETYSLNGNSVVSPTEGVTYCWYSKGLIDTVKGQSTTITIPDSLATFAVQYIAKCTGYYNQSVSNNITVVKPGFNGSIEGIPQPKDSIFDTRENKWYHIQKIGNLNWFTENLNYEGAGVPYGNAPAAGTVFGRLYTWNEATGGESRNGLGNGPQGICPDGWSVPTNEDWQDLAKVALGADNIDFFDDWKGVGDALAVSATFNGNNIWPFSGTATPNNKLGWNALATGYVTNGGNNFGMLFKYGFWWSSSEKDSNSAYYRYIFYNQTGCPVNHVAKDMFGISVRCVKKI